MAISSPLVQERPLRGLPRARFSPPEVYRSVQLIIALIESITLLIGVFGSPRAKNIINGTLTLFRWLIMDTDALLKFFFFIFI